MQYLAAVMQDTAFKEMKYEHVYSIVIVIRAIGHLVFFTAIKSNAHLYLTNRMEGIAPHDYLPTIQMTRLILLATMDITLKIQETVQKQ